MGDRFVNKQFAERNRIVAGLSDVTVVVGQQEEGVL